MDDLVRQVKRAHRRLVWQRFVFCLPYCWFAMFVATLALVAADRFALGGFQPAERLADLYGMAESRTASQASWLFIVVASGLALAIGTIAAAVYSWLTRSGSLEAAIEIDRRFGLKERVSSSLALTAAERETRAGRAVVEDAVRRVREIRVGEQFSLRFGRWSWTPIVPAALAFALAMLWHPSWDAPSKVKANKAADQQRIKVSAAKLQNQTAEKIKEAKEKGLDEKTTEILKKLNDATDEMAKSPDANKEESITKLKDLEKELQQRRDELGADGLKEQFAQMKNMPQGPADKMAQALKDGKFQKAEKELQKLAEELKKGNLDPKAKEALQKQLKEMQEKLGEMAKQHQQAMQNLRDKIAQEQKAGNKDEAQRLQKLLEQLQKAGAGMKQGQKMAAKMGALADQLKAGNNQAALDGMKDLAEMLAKMDGQMAELAMLNEMGECLGECKNGMCQGEGNKERRQDFAKGKGIGAGARDEDKTKTGTYDTRTKPKQAGNDAQVVDFVDGVNMKGDVQQAITTQIEASEKGAESDALTNQPLSRNYRDHAQEYLDSLIK